MINHTLVHTTWNCKYARSSRRVPLGRELVSPVNEEPRVLRVGLFFTLIHKRLPDEFYIW